MSFFTKISKSAAFLFIAFIGVPAYSQLQWGANGAGGNSSWDDTSLNWFDGTQSVAWSQNGNAIFGGSGGTVTASTFKVTAAGMTFNSPGYTLTGGWIFAGSSGLTVTTNGDATIGTTLSSQGLSGSLLTKNGAGTLSMSGTNFLNVVQVNAGEFRTTGSGSLFFSNVAVAAGARVTLGQTTSSDSMQSLSGSGIVQPSNADRTVSLTLFGGATFGGTLQDNGAGKLGLQVFASGPTMVLSGANSYSGPTQISAGMLALAGTNGSALNTSVTISSSSTLLLDNSGAANANRLSDTAPITLSGGSLRMDGNSAAGVNENVGAITFSGASTIAVNRSGGADAALTVAGWSRNGHATMNVTGNGQLLGTGVANLSSGIAPVYFRSGSDWATVDANGAFRAFTSYAPDAATAGPGDHVKISAPTLVSGTKTWASLNLVNNTNATADLLQGGTVQLASGGLLSTGTAAAQLSKTNLTTTAPEMVITNMNALNVMGAIQESAPGLAVTKSGSGTLRFYAPNTYSGPTTINEGALEIYNSAAFGTSPTLEFGGGTLRLLGNMTLPQNLTRSTSSVATIDTGANNVVLTGTNSALQKVGSGTLRMTNANIGSVTVSAGVLDVGNAGAGSSARLENGTLIAAGSLTNLSIGSGASMTLDIGGAAAATLHSSTAFSNSSGNLTINFGLGSAGSDLWALDPGSYLSASLPTGFFRFAFQPLGEIALNTNYTLLSSISSSTFTGVSTDVFALSPDLVAAGWTATFSKTPNLVQVRFTAVPEPGTGWLLVFAASAWSFRRRRAA